jgi:hypothetical protein
MSVTLDDVAEMVGRRAGGYTAGIASGGSTTTLADTTGLYQQDHYWNNFFVRMRSGSNNGQERLVSDYTLGLLALATTMPNAIGAGDSYELKPMLHAEVLDAVKGAIFAAEQAWLRVVVDESLSGGEIVNLPVDCWGVLNVSSDGQALTNYRLSGQPGSQQLMFEEAPSGSALRVEYVAAPNLMTAATDVSGMGEGERQWVDFIVEYSLHLVHERRMAGNITGEAARGHLSLVQMHLQKAEAIRDRRPAGRGGRMTGQMRVGEQV